MFHLTHLYCTEKAGGKHPALLFGSTLLDLPIVAGNYLNWKHFTGMQPWFKKIKDPYLRKGLLSHVAVDYVGHGKLNPEWTQGTGYAYKWFEGRFPKLRGVRFHSAPEWFMELYVAKTHTEAFALFGHAVKHVNLNAISDDLAQATGYDKKILLGALERFIPFMRAINAGTRFFAHTSNSGQGREECLNACISAARTMI